MTPCLRALAAPAETLGSVPCTLQGGQQLSIMSVQGDPALSSDFLGHCTQVQEKQSYT